MLMLADVAYGQASKAFKFRSVFSGQDVELQANPHTSFWQQASPVIANADEYGREVPHHRTEVRSRWTEHNLYLLFVCPYDDLFLHPDPNTAGETFELWNWDVAEIFIGSNWKDIRRYKEFEVSPQAEWVDLDINLDLPDHTVGWTWNSGMHVAARIDRSAHVWYGAMVIPFASIESKSPRVGAAFRANLFRSQGPEDKRKSIAWRPPMTESFHTPENFGELVLAKK